jgi:hypothetical protein
VGFQNSVTGLDLKPVRLLDTQTFEGAIAYLTYQSVRDA